MKVWKKEIHVSFKEKFEAFLWNPQRHLQIMVSAGISLTIPKEAFAMNENKVTINEMIARMVAEARRLGYSESSIWTNFQPGLRAFAIYYGKKGISFYDPEITNEYVGLQQERMSRSEISDYQYKNIRSAANRLNEFYLTGTIHWTIRTMARIRVMMWSGWSADTFIILKNADMKRWNMSLSMK